MFDLTGKGYAYTVNIDCTPLSAKKFNLMERNIMSRTARFIVFVIVMSLCVASLSLVSAQDEITLNVVGFVVP